MVDPNPILFVQTMDFCSLSLMAIGYGYIVLIGEA